MVLRGKPACAQDLDDQTPGPPDARQTYNMCGSPVHRYKIDHVVNDINSLRECSNGSKGFIHDEFPGFIVVELLMLSHGGTVQ